MFNYSQIESVLKEKEYSLDKRVGYPNFIGVRFFSKMNAFDDELYIITYGTKTNDSENNITMSIYPFSTDPGLYALHHPINAKGTFIMAPGYYKDLWTFGLHKGKYKAFVQLNPCTGYRDNNKDDKYDLLSKTLTTGINGINMHKSGIDSVTVDNYSYGCQIFKKSPDFAKVLKQAEQSGYTKFNYILINSYEI